MKKINVLIVLMLLLISMVPIHADPDGGSGDDKIKIAYVSSRGGDIVLMNAAATDAAVSGIITVYSVSGVTYNPDLYLEDLSSYDIIILDGLAEGPIRTLEDTLIAAKDNGAVIIVNGYDTLANSLKTSIDNANSTNITDYLNFPSEINFKNLLLYLAKFYTSGSDPVPLAVKTNVYGVYHPDRESREFFENASEYLSWYADPNANDRIKNEDGSFHLYDPDKPTIGIMPSSNFSRMNRDSPILDYFVRAVEAEGYNVLVGTYVYNATNDVGPNANRDNYIISGEPVVDVVISLSRGGRFFSTSVDEGVRELENLGVTVLTAVQLYENKTQEEWEESDYGVFPTQHYQLAFAEQDGMIEPIVVAAKPKDGFGVTIDRNDPIDYQADWMVQRAIGWANLATMKNSDKKIAITYYAAEAGKTNIGSDPDYYLNAPESILNLLQALKDEGYDVGDAPLPTYDEFVEMLVQNGHNVGTWAPGELERMVANGTAHLFPVDSYLEYYNSLDSAKRNEVEKIWGAAPGNIMVYQNNAGKEFFVIPVIEFGNVLLTPTPLRGRDQSMTALTSEKDYPPTHQALAVYYYLNREENDGGFGADALLPIWSNLATMPGKQAGLSAKDWTALMIQDLPHIHILPMDATGVTDKRRANMRIITFLTPTLIPGELYGNLASLNTEIQNYKTASDDSVKAASLELIIGLCSDTGMDSGLNLKWNEIKDDPVLTEEALNKLIRQLHEIKNSLIPYGDHILGVAPEGDELVMMIESMLTYNSNIDSILEGLYPDEEERASKKTALVTSAVIDMNSPGGAVFEVLGSSNAQLENIMDQAIGYQNDLENCHNEIQGLLDALDGKYIKNSPTGDPIQNPEGLPTGRNPVQADSRTIPTQAAYNVGKTLADNLIQNYQKDRSGYPEKVAFLLWAVETARNGGTSESEIFYLMGVEPVWSTANGRISGLKLIEGWDKPRVDVVVETSGSYRDVYSRQVLWINEAVRLAADAPDNGQPNYIKLHSEDIYLALKAENDLKNPSDQLSDEYLRQLSYARVFGPPLGEYTPGIENLAGSGLEDEIDAADLYIQRMSNVYGVQVTVDGVKTDLWGEQMPSLLQQNLKDVEMGVFSRSSNVYGLLDHPMVASYFGGLASAILKSGGNPDMYINNLRNGGTDVQTLSEFLNMDLNSRYFNPAWVEGMMNSGYAGTSHMNEFFEVMGVWQMTMPDMITGSMWRQMYDVYMADSMDTGVTDYLKSANPYAYQSMTASLLNSIYNGNWDASDEIRQQLEMEYVTQTNLNGVVCCHHTCGNMKFNENIVKGLTSMDLPNSEKQKYLNEVETVLERKLTTSSNSGSNSNRSGAAIVLNENDSGTFSANSDETISAGSGYGQDSSSAGSVPQQVSGYEMTSQRTDSLTDSLRDFISNPTASAISIIVIALIVIIVGAVFFGSLRKGF